MDLSSVGTALDLLTKTSKALDSVREQSKTSRDTSLKENISKLYDDFLDLKAVILRLTEEIAALNIKLARQTERLPTPVIKQVGKSNYYYVGDDGPFCQPCYDGTGKLVRLQPQSEFAGGTGRRCEVCGKVFFEQRRSTSSPRIRTGWSY